MFELNDDVWSISYGWGIVKEIEGENDYSNHLVVVEFTNKKRARYTLDGKFDECGFRDLFFEEIQIPKSALIRPRKSARRMLSECKEVEFKIDEENYYIYKKTLNGKVYEEYDTITMVYGIKYISKEDAEKIVKECKENNRG